MASDADLRLVDAAERGDVPEIERLVAAGADPNALEGIAVAIMTPLQQAALYNHTAAVGALLAAGAHVNGTDSDGNTPLFYAAAAKDSSSTIDVLLAAGAALSHASAYGSTALHWAVRWDSLHAVRALLDAGARMYVRNNKGQPPIDMVRDARVGAAAVLVPARGTYAAPPPPFHPFCCAQLSSVSEAAGESGGPSIRTLLASAAPWSRRRPVAAACYGALWEDDA
jgi:uncharacterized protein